VITLVIGGTRSGKSEVAERIAAKLGGPVTVIAPAVVDDPDFAARVAAHQARRPNTWTTIECGPDLVRAIETTDGPLLVDSLGSWVAALPGMVVDSAALVAALQAHTGSSVVVSEEVGLAVHPPTPAGRRFADALGALNLDVARHADEVLLVVAGRTMRLDPGFSARSTVYSAAQRAENPSTDA
jgi:adenosyl cobinamide kinase/adenosyl cobinamide phosphate guanylyltransferase